MKGFTEEDLGQKQGGGKVCFLVELAAHSGVLGCFSH